MKEKQITISINEYKELLLKERPNDNDKWLLEKIKEFIVEHCKLNQNCKTIEIESDWRFSEELLKFLKMIDINFYKAIVKKCYDKKLEEEEIKLRVEKMNAIKELNKENKGENNE